MKHLAFGLLIWVNALLALGGIEGHLRDEEGRPVEGVKVFLYGADLLDTTNQTGHFILDDVISAAPRYIVWAEKAGYHPAVEGWIDVEEGKTTPVDLILEREREESSYKTQILDVRLCYLIDHKRLETEPAQPAEDAVRDTALYPDSIKPYLKSGLYMDKDNPSVMALAETILSSIPEEMRFNQTEVAKAVYLWVVKNIDYDLMDRYPGDVTCGNWQTVNGGWGKNFAHWCYLPEEVIKEGRAICIEYERLTATLLRALDIPARPAPLKAHPVTQWWVQLPDGSGYWANMETSWGHILYEQGDTLAKFPSRPDNRIAFWMPNADAPIHNDWNLEHPCLWREVTDAGGARLDHTSSGLSETEDLLLEFEKKGEIRYGGPPPEPGPNYEIYTRGFQVLLPTVGKQRRIIASFPLFIDNEYNSTLDYEIWTNHPEWIKSIWVDTLTNNGTLESLPILYAELELMPIKVKEVSFYNPDFEQGITLPDFWNTLSAPPGNSLFSLSDNAMSGSHSAYIKNPTDGVGAFCQTISVEEGDVIRIDGWIKVAGLQEHAFASIDVVFFGDYENPPPYPGTYPKRFSSAQGWTKVWGTYYAPPETDSAEVRCTLIGEGEVWFDDLKLLVSHGSEQGTEEINSRSPIPKLEIHPNPFMRSALISYQLPAKNRVNLEIYNASGQKIRILLDEKQSIGYHGVVWDGTDTLGKKVASGVYFCTLKAGNSIKTKKLLLLK